MLMCLCVCFCQSPPLFLWCCLFFNKRNGSVCSCFCVLQFWPKYFYSIIVTLNFKHVFFLPYFFNQLLRICHPIQVYNKKNIAKNEFYDKKVIFPHTIFGLKISQYGSKILKQNKKLCRVAIFTILQYSIARAVWPL